MLTTDTQLTSMTKYKELQEILAVLKLDDGTYSIHGLPYQYVETWYPEIDWAARKPVIVSEEEAISIMYSVADTFGYKVERI